MDNGQVVKTLSRLVEIADAGERGYATAAVSIRNPGLKVLFKSYAQQRARLQDELMAEIDRLDGGFDPPASLVGMIHRGRIAILATMTIEDERREQGVIKEALTGERYALRAYQGALTRDLPAPTRQLLERQQAEIQEVFDQVDLLREHDGRRMYVQLCDSASDVESAIQSLKRSGLPEGAIERFV
ncbi:MAG TPA: PA2169 family four-helix-bundle protein, partial [Anaerolineaceae bacterium]|nr:PA2169 family four-helix-bundle protein [Anaerolineaceae bacterium]